MSDPRYNGENEAEYYAQVEAALSDEERQKVDQAIECAVIDWLQWGEKFDVHIAQNTLTIIKSFKTKLAERDKILDVEHARGFREGHLLATKQLQSDLDEAVKAMKEMHIDESGWPLDTIDIETAREMHKQNNEIIERILERIKTKKAGDE
jgi:signal transduction protein with GAF and PtsI domain